MSSKILVTGAAGYIGGSIVADFLSDKNPFIGKGQIIAAVRSKEQVDALSKLGIPILQLDLSDEQVVADAIASHNVNIIINTTSAIDPAASLILINALNKFGETSGKKTYFIHTSGLSGFFPNTGWPEGDFKDTDGVFETEKKFADSFPVRNTDVTIIEHAEKQGVTSFRVIPPLVYGKGTGEWNKLSVNLPVSIKAALSEKALYKFPEDPKNSAVHISDLTALYGLIVKKVLQGQTIPSGREGYYFGIAHDFFLGDFLDHLAVAMKSRGLITDSQVQIYPNNQVAAESLGVPEPFVRVLWNSGNNLVAQIPFRIGWEPQWSKDRFYENIDDEIDAVLELGKAKSSMIDSLFKAAQG
ncbi:hypothetical protein FQN54_007954 [Arachnomyces sp. PD_36]|nr:hypothetical protein FQN54_007954 [Arachnomyces sp. PD_36]